MSLPVKRTPPKYEVLKEEIRVTRPSENGQGTHIIWYPRHSDERIPYPHHSFQAQSLETESISVPLAYGPGPFSRYNSISVPAEEMNGVLPNSYTPSREEHSRTGRLLYTQSSSSEEFSASASIDRSHRQVESHRVLTVDQNCERSSDGGRTFRPEDYPRIPLTPSSNPRARMPSSSYITPPRNGARVADEDAGRPRAMTPPYISASEYDRTMARQKPVMGARFPSTFGNFDNNRSRAETPVFIPAPDPVEKEQLVDTYVQAHVLSPRSTRKATLRSANKRGKD